MHFNSAMLQRDVPQFTKKLYQYIIHIYFDTVE